jgi:pyruvate/2-oxoglutarate dehydrogenase complex dihydrolipoamide acyltransferase (E2) component
MNNILKLRKQLKEDGIKASVNDFIIKAAGVALKVSPNLVLLPGFQKGRDIKAS